MISLGLCRKLSTKFPDHIWYTLQAELYYEINSAWKDLAFDLYEAALDLDDSNHGACNVDGIHHSLLCFECIGKIKGLLYKVAFQSGNVNLCRSCAIREVSWPNTKIMKRLPRDQWLSSHNIDLSEYSDFPGTSIDISSDEDWPDWSDVSSEEEMRINSPDTQEMSNSRQNESKNFGDGDIIDGEDSAQKTNNEVGLCDQDTVPRVVNLSSNSSTSHISIHHHQSVDVLFNLKNLGLDEDHSGESDQIPVKDRGVPPLARKRRLEDVDEYAQM